MRDTQDYLNSKIYKWRFQVGVQQKHITWKDPIRQSDYETTRH